MSVFVAIFDCTWSFNSVNVNTIITSINCVDARLPRPVQRDAALSTGARSRPAVSRPSATSQVVTMTSRLAGATVRLASADGRRDRQSWRRRRTRRRRPPPQPRALSATSKLLMMLATIIVTCDTGLYCAGAVLSWARFNVPPNTL